jgi:signal transduction histidine kinase
MVNLASTLLEDTIIRNESAHLLIVDDDPAQAHDLSAYMQRMGYDVSVAYGGHDALEMVFELRPDLVILDLAMPDLDGLTVCQQIRSDSSLGYLPVIIVTEVEVERQRLAGMLSGADDYLRKPVLEKDLLLRVQALLRTKFQLDRLITENQALTENLRSRNLELERALEMAQQAEVLKNHIMESVNHELRTPMLQIKTAVSMLVEVIKEVSSVERDQTIARMATGAVTRMEELVSNISELHLVENLKPSPVMLNDSIHQAINNLRRSWSHKDDFTRVQFVPEDLPPIFADRRAVSRILVLLLDNALKFSPADSPVYIFATVENLDGQQVVRVNVKDEGIGIPKQYQEKVFEPFFQIDAGTARRYNGAGVGLALTRMLARGMGTDIELKSRPKQGSIFSFVLTIADLESDDYS